MDSAYTCTLTNLQCAREITCDMGSHILDTTTPQR